MICFGFIGTGSMGSMLIRQFIKTGAIAATDIIASSKTGISANALAADTGITVKASNNEIAREADVLFLCVKPIDVKPVLEKIRDDLSEDKLLVSIAGVVSLDNLAEWSGPGIRCVKMIPSVTVTQCSGVTLVAWGRGVMPEDTSLIISLLSTIGTPVEIEEHYFDLFADLTSTAPAFFATMMQEYAAAAIRKEDVPEALVENLVQLAMIGTVKILSNELALFDDLIGRVATKGGITEEGVKVLRDQLPAVFDEVLNATMAKRELLRQRITEEYNI